MMVTKRSASVSAIWIEGKEITAGYIGLQAEGQGVEFENIRIRDLESK